MRGLRQEADFKLEWHAFLLDPNFPRQGEPIQQYYHRRFGPNADALAQRIKDAGARDVATFKSWNWRANTLPGHRLVALAKRYGKSHDANELLFQKTYEEGENISDIEVVEGVGRALGLPGVEDYLRDESAGLQEVLRDDQFGKQMLDVSGVPFFIVGADPPHAGGKRYAFSGAQPPEEFQRVFARVLQDAQGSKSAQLEAEL